MELRISEWLLIASTILGPILAVQAQKLIERMREGRQRRLQVFFNLMSTRAARVSASHVQALNMIDVEFYGYKVLGLQFQPRKQKKVIEAWKAYHDHLNEPFGPEEVGNWSRRGEDLFIDLLHDMSQALGYDFDKVHLRRGIYSPKAHSEHEMALISIRDSLVKILSGEQALPMSVVSFPASPEDLSRHRQLQEGWLDYLEGKRTVKVEIETKINE